MIIMVCVKLTTPIGWVLFNQIWINKTWGFFFLNKSLWVVFEQYEIKSNDPPVVKCGKLILCIM